MKPGQHRFEIPSQEGLPIRGVIHAAAQTTCVVVLVHGFKGFKDWGFFPWTAETLRRLGITTVRFDMSRNGIGEKPGEFDRLDLFADDTYSIERADLLSVIRHLETAVGDVPVFLTGHSMGGGVAILAAASIPTLHGIVTWNSISDVDRWGPATRSQWRRDGYLDVLNTRTRQLMRKSTAVLDDLENNRASLDIGAAAANLRVPLLIIHGASDESVPVAEARTLLGYKPDASITIIESANHTYGAQHPLRRATPQLILATKLTQHFVSISCRLHL